MNSTLRSVYNSGIGRAAELLGLDRLLFDAYCQLGVWKGGIASESIAGIEAQFYLFGPWPRQNHDAFYSEAEERPILRDLLQNLGSDDVFFDVGANYGQYSCFAAKTTTGRVVAFDPSEFARSLFRKNLALNDVDVQIEDKYLTSTAVVGDRQAIRGDQYVAGEGAPDVLKIDVEGHELEVVKGFQGTLNTSPPHTIYIEVHHADESRGWSVSQEEESELMDILSSAGYSIETIHERNTESFIKATI